MSILRPRFITTWTEQLGKIRLNAVSASVRSLKARAIIEYGTAREKLKDIPATNYTLGIYHFQRQNVFDAILRFRLVTWLRPTHAQAHLYLAKSYILANKLVLAKKSAETALSLDGSLSDAQFILKKIADPGSVTSVPSTCILEHLTAADIRDAGVKAPAARKNRTRAITRKILSHISDSNPHLNILELSPSDGQYAVACQLRKVVSAIDALAATPSRAHHLSTSEINHAPLYRHVRQDIIPDALLRPLPSPSYDVIIADRAFDYSGDLAAIFQTLHTYLSPGGVFACVLSIHLKDTPGAFDIQTDRFTYTEQSVIHALGEAGYIILETDPVDMLVRTASAADPFIVQAGSKRSVASSPYERFFLCKKTN